MHRKSVAAAAIVYLSIAIGASRTKKQQVSAAIDRVNKDAARYTASGDDSLLSSMDGLAERTDPPSAPAAAADEELWGQRLELANAKEAKPMKAAVLLEEKATEMTSSPRVPRHKASARTQPNPKHVPRSGRLPQTLPQRGPPEEKGTGRRSKFVEAARGKTHARTGGYADKLRAERRAASEAAAAERAVERAAELRLENLQRLSMDDLKETCRSATLSDAGTRAALVDRCQRWFVDAGKKRAKIGRYHERLQADKRALAKARARAAERAAERLAERSAERATKRAAARAAGWDSENLHHKSLEDLQERCRRANVSDVGTKAALVDALKAKQRKREEVVDSSDDAEEEVVDSSDDAEEEVVDLPDDAEGLSFRDFGQEAQDRSLRANQNQEYLEALELDILREEVEEVEAAEREEAEREAATLRQVEEAQFAKLVAERQALEERRRVQARQLPPPGLDATATIALKLPTGQRIERKLSPQAKLADVYAWADCLADLPEHESKGLLIPQRFMLKAGFPNRDLTEMGASIHELQLEGAVILLVDTEDDE